MKKLMFLLIIIVSGCQSVKINNQKYRVSQSLTELGTIGQAKSFGNMQNEYSPRAIAQLEDKIRLEVQILPFNENINKIYLKKSAISQSPVTISYSDSLQKKPEYVLVTIMDINGLLREINNTNNKDISAFIKNTKESSIITAVAIVLPEDINSKIRQADTFYLVNDQDKKYTIALYRSGKELEKIDLQQGTLLAYTTGKFCWALNERHQWYIGDIVNDNDACPGNTSKSPKKKNDNLFKM